LLRRNFTGANAVLALLALLTFLVPRELTIVGLFLLDVYHDVIADSILIPLDRLLVPQNEILNTGSPTCTSYYAWQVALGIHEGGTTSYAWAALIILLLIYNVGRFWLTMRVIPLRDAETRSNVTPALADYIQLYQWHRWLTPVGVLAFVVLLYNAGRFVLWFATEQINLFGQ
jgi:hypothetical protein